MVSVGYSRNQRVLRHLRGSQSRAAASPHQEEPFWVVWTSVLGRVLHVSAGTASGYPGGDPEADPGHRGGDYSCRLALKYPGVLPEEPEKLSVSTQYSVAQSCGHQPYIRTFICLLVREYINNI